MRVLLDRVNEAYPDKRVWFVVDSVSVHDAVMRNLFSTGGPGARHIIMRIPPKCSFLNAIEEIFAFLTFRVRELIGAVRDGELRLTSSSSEAANAPFHQHAPVINGAVLRVLVRMALDDVSPELLNDCVTHVHAFAEKCYNSLLIDPKQRPFVASEYKRFVKRPALPVEAPRRWNFYHLCWIAEEDLAEKTIPGITAATAKRARSRGWFCYVDGKRYKLDPAIHSYVLAPIKSRRGKKRALEAPAKPATA